MGDRNLSAAVIALLAMALRNSYDVARPSLCTVCITDVTLRLRMASQQIQETITSLRILGLLYISHRPPKDVFLCLFWRMSGRGRRAAVCQWCSIQLPYVGHNTIVALSVSNAPIQIHRMTLWYISFLDNRGQSSRSTSNPWPSPDLYI